MKTPADPHPHEEPFEEKGKKKRASKARRHHGEGTVFQRKDGRWQANISMGADENGKRKRLTRYGHTKAEALHALQLAQQEIGQGTLLKGSQETVGQFLDYWLEQVHKATLKPRSYVLYRENLNHHLLPGLGYIQLQKLTTAHIQAFYSKKQREGFAPGSIHLMNRILSAALKDALKWERISKDPSKNVQLPRKEKHQVPLLTKEQAQGIVEAAKTYHMEALIALALTTGMRRGELIGLRWSNINFENKSIQVAHTVAFFPIDGTNQFVESSPKTASSRRQIMLPQFVLEMLTSHKEYQQIQSREAGDRWQDYDLVFTTGKGTYLDPATIYTNFKRILRDAAVPNMRFHDLRHNAATFFAGMGVHPKVVQEILGHADIKVTLDIYSHVLPKEQRLAMDGMDNLFH